MKREESLQKGVLRATEDISYGKGFSPLFNQSTHKAEYVLGRRDIANSSPNPSESRPCSWQASVAFAAGRQQAHPLPSRRSNSPQFSRQYLGKRSHCSNNYGTVAMKEAWHAGSGPWLTAPALSSSRKLIPARKGFL